MKCCLIYETESCSYVLLFIFWRSFVLNDVYPIEKILVLFSDEENMRKSATIFKFRED